MSALCKWAAAVAFCVAAGVLVLGASGAFALAGLCEPAQAATTPLGGFTVSALGEASSFQYEQPNFPLPSTPSLEFDEGYAETTDNYGPTGSATASSLWPGSVVATAGPNLPSFEPGVPLPALPTWPIVAKSAYPATPTASDSKPGVTMSSSSGQGGSDAVARIGNAPTATPATCGSTTAPASGLPGLPALTGLGSLAGLGTGSSSSTPSAALAATSALGQVQMSAGTSSSTTANGVATATASATDSCVSILGGLITLGSVTSTATATSNGQSAKVSGTTTVTGATIGGVPVTIDATGIHADGVSSPSNPLLSTVTSALSTLGVTLSVTHGTPTVKGPQASEDLNGLRVSVDLTSLDAQAQKFTSLLPASLTAELPVPVPTKQVLTWDLGTVDVSVTASPAYVATTSTAPSAPTAGTGGSGSGAAAPAPAPAATSATTVGSVPSSTSGLGATAGTGSYPGGSSASGTPAKASTATASGSGHPAANTASSLPLGFKGIGIGLILLGLLTAGALAFVNHRANVAAEAGEGADCPDPGAPGEDPAQGVTDGEGVMEVWSDALS